MFDEIYFYTYRIAKKVKITPITKITNEPTVPPTVAAKLSDKGDLKVFKVSGETD